MSRAVWLGFGRWRADCDQCGPVSPIGLTCEEAQRRARNHNRDVHGRAA